MHSDLLRHFFDHHGLQRVNPAVQEFGLAGNDGITNFEDGLLALFNVFDELNGGFVALLDVIANVFLSGIAMQQPAIRRVQPQLRDVILIHEHQILIALLYESDVWLD